MGDIVFTHQHVKDTIMIEEEHEFSVYLSVGLEEKGDFYIGIEFINLTEETLPIAAELYKREKALSFKSELLSREGYNVTHIVCTNMQASNTGEMKWDCISDDPSMSLILD